MNIVHVYPTDDIREHLTDGDQLCPCVPMIEPHGASFIAFHQCFDGREWRKNDNPRSN